MVKYGTSKGVNVYEPLKINIEKKIKDIYAYDGCTYFVDEEGEIWMSGYINGKSNTDTPIKLKGVIIDINEMNSIYNK